MTGGLRRVVALALVLSAMAWPASACIVFEGRGEKARAMRQAEDVVVVDALTEAYLDVPGDPGRQVGVATGRVVEVRKGRLPVGRVIAYRVADGDDGANCPALRSTTPGKRYTLYLKYPGDRGPPVILYRDPFYGY